MMEGMMKVAVMNGIGKMGFEERPIPKPAANEVLVKLEYVGICGSDLHYNERTSSWQAFLWEDMALSKRRFETRTATLLRQAFRAA